MLIHLDITNYLLIEKTTVHFKNGLTVVTGESGSGKSILIEALNRVFSGPINQTHALNPQNPILLSITFQISTSHPLHNILTTDYDTNRPNGLYTLTRTVKAGRSAHHLNGHKMPARLAKQCQTSLIFYLAQQASFTILKTEAIEQTLNQLVELSLRNHLHTAFNDWHHLNQQYQHDQHIINQMTDSDLHRYFLNELDVLSPSDDELRQLKEQFEVQKDDQKIQDALMQFMSVTQSFINQPQLKNQLQHIQELTHQNDSLRHIKTFESHLASLEQWLSDMMEDGLTTQDTPTLKNSYEQYQKLASKHRIPVEQLVILHQKLTTQLQEYDQAVTRLPDYEHQINEKQQIYLQYEQLYLDACQRLATQISQQIQDQLPLLGLKHAHFSIRMTKQNHPPSRTANLVANIWFSSHVSKEPQPIDDIASGGEKARIALLMNLLVQKNHDQKMLIFDEADIGLGGKTAAGLGELLKYRATKQPILCITHLPQIAGYGDHHLSVSKQTQSNQTNIQLLDSQQRITELARMLGGKTISDASLSQAKQLLSEANKKPL